MTYLGKGSEDDDTESHQDSNLKRNDLVKAIVKQDDILKQSIKTVGFDGHKVSNFSSKITA